MKKFLIMFLCAILIVVLAGVGIVVAMTSENSDNDAGSYESTGDALLEDVPDSVESDFGTEPSTTESAAVPEESDAELAEPGAEDPDVPVTYEWDCLGEVQEWYLCEMDVRSTEPVKDTRYGHEAHESDYEPWNEYLKQWGIYEFMQEAEVKRIVDDHECRYQYKRDTYGSGPTTCDYAPCCPIATYDMILSWHDITQLLQLSEDAQYSVQFVIADYAPDAYFDESMRWPRNAFDFFAA